MCAGCGILQNNRDWTEEFGLNSPDTLPAHARLAEKRRRISLVNELLTPCGLTLKHQGRQLILCAATGKSVLVSNLAHVWREADKIGRRPADPLNF